MLSAVTDELDRILTGGKIERVTQPTPLDVILRVFTPNGKYDLLLSADAEFARAHLTWIKRENPPQPYAFCSLLRKYLDGARIAAFDRPAGFGERILVVRLKTYDGAPLSLVVEIMGRHSNVILVSGPETILGAVKHISGDINRVREILPGLTYQGPPRQRGKVDPLLPYPGDAETPMTDDEAASWLVQRFAGVSPLLAREAVLRAGSIGSPLTEQTVADALSAILDAVRGKDFKPIVWSDDAGATLGAYPVHLLSVPERNQYDRQSMSLALDNAASSMGKRSAYDSARESLLAALHRARKNRQHDLDDIARGLDNSARADEYQESGDLLQANQASLTRGEASVTVDDYYSADGGPLPKRTIAVDPAVDWRENAEKYYKKAAKARASRTMLEERRLTVQEELNLLLRAETDAAAATSEEQVEEIHERVAGLLQRGQRPGAVDATRQRPEGPRFEGHKIRAFRSVDGWEILVGENATSNDYLTTKLASSSDIWLHVRAATSAHGVIRAQNRPASVSTAAIRHAAELVAARSEVKHSSLIPVDYTLKKYVRKPRKSAPGSVTYEKEKTIYVGGINSRD